MLLAIVVAGIVLGSLYPFDFRVPAHGDGPVATLLAGWARRPGRGDLFANILLYMPFGLCALLAMRRPAGIAPRLVLEILAGGALSVAMELSQYFDADRVTTATDVYANLLGTAIGALAGRLFRVDSRRLPLDRLRANPVPTLLLMTWATDRLYPYEPTVDLHKYWQTLKPLLSPSLDGWDLYRHTVIWLTLFQLVATLAGERRGRLLAPLFAFAMLAAKVLILDATLSAAEVAGAFLAAGLWPLIAGQRWRPGLLAALLAAYVIAARLQPFTFLPAARDFGWVPFASLLAGSPGVDALSLLEKVFLYGSLLFLLAEAGLRPGRSALLVAAGLFFTSWIETWLPGRSAETTDAVLALLLAAAFALLRREAPAQVPQPGHGRLPSEE